MENIDLDLSSKLNEIQNYSIIRPYKCKECDVTFERASQFDYHHRSIHLNEKSQLCEICGKSFFRKTDLQTHLKIHSGTNSCICEICGRSFSHMSNLIRHCRIHAGVKPYPCSVCGKRFNQVNSLARHKRIHQRSVDKPNKQSGNNSNEEDKDQSRNNESVEGTLTQRKVLKRKHYCKICGESFDLVPLLRQHEKLHRHVHDLHSCKICKKKESEFKEHNCDEEVVLNSVEAKTTLPVEENAVKHNTGICIYNHDLQQIVPLEKIIYIPSEESSIINDIHLLLCKSNEGKNDNVLWMEANRNNSTIVNESIEEDVSLEASKNEKDSSEETSECTSVKTVADNQLSSEQNIISADAAKSLAEKSNEKSHYNIAVNIPVNVNHVSRKLDSEGETEEQTKLTEDNSCVNQTAHCQEPMLRLVQTENGEQFYEFIISNMVEKSVDIGSTVEGKEQESAHSSEAKNSEHVEQEFQRFASISNDPNYIPYDLQSIDRTYPTLHHDEHESLFCTTPRKKGLFSPEKISNPAEPTQHGLLACDVQTEFDRYVETNFEVFGKLSYENSSEQFLELNEITENNCEVSEYVETSHSFVQNDSEQLFEFLQVSQVDKNQTQAFTQIDNVQENVSMCNSKINEVAGTSENNGSKESEGAAVKTSKIHSRQSASKNDTCQEIGKARKKPLMKFQCTECEKLFSSSYSYKQHKGTHFTDQQKFHCKDCGLSFAWKTTLNKHMTNYHRADGPQRFVCSLCPKVYGTSSQVNEHVKRDHWKHLNHTCSQCGKCFFKKYDLKTHLRTHTGERPYVCRWCGKRFHHRSHIIRHEQIHV